MGEKEGGGEVYLNGNCQHRPYVVVLTRRNLHILVNKAII